MDHTPTILITGGTGLIGTALSKLLVDKKYDVIILTRKAIQKIGGNAEQRIQYAEWDINKQTINEEAIRKADHIIHLAGANVGDKRWTDKRKKEILTSRTESSALIVKALREIPNKVKTIVSASGIGWYGEDQGGGKMFTEEDPPAEGFLGDTCKAWENSIEPIKHLGKRLVILRTGLVLSNLGGVLAEFSRPLNFGMASILGSGKQMISWIHIEDICRLFCFAIENEKMEGVFNAVSLNPVSNKSLALEFAKSRRRNFFIPIHVPSFILKLMLGEMSIEVLKSTSVSNQKIRHAGFRYVFPTLEAALGALAKES